MNILLAEDDAVTRRVLISQLKKLGHVVTEAEDGVEALARFGELHPQVLITDWMMPNMDGPTLCKKIREEKTKEYTYHHHPDGSGKEDRLYGRDEGRSG